MCCVTPLIHVAVFAAVYVVFIKLNFLKLNIHLCVCVQPFKPEKL